MKITDTEYKVIAPLIMCAGIGDGRTMSCVMAQAATIDALRKGLTLGEPTDRMGCACPVLRRFAIFLNDACWWESNAERTEVLRPLIPFLLDSRGDDNLTARRLFYSLDNFARSVIPNYLDLFASSTEDKDLKLKLTETAREMRDLPEINSRESAKNASEFCETQRAKFLSKTASISAYFRYAHKYTFGASFLPFSKFDELISSFYDFLHWTRFTSRDFMLEFFYKLAAIR